jgi:hypothetical protein
LSAKELEEQGKEGTGNKGKPRAGFRATIWQPMLRRKLDEDLPNVRIYLGPAFT